MRNPQHPYTRGLIAAMPQSEQRGTRLSQIPGMMPNLTSIPAGCAFNPRCPHAMDICRTRVPQMFKAPETGGEAACFLLDQQRK